MKSSRLQLACLFSFLAGAWIGLYAQGPGSISGTVRESSGTALSGVSVTLTSKQVPPFIKQLTTNAKGLYQFTDLPSGEYNVSAARSGYAAAASPVIDISPASEGAERDLTLTPVTATPSSQKLQLQASGLHGLIDPGGYSASAGAAAASGVVLGIANIKRADGSFQTSIVRHLPCALEPALRQDTAAHPDQAAANQRLGHFYVAHQQPAKAIPLLIRALQIDSGEPDASQDLATALLQSGRFAEARSLLIALVARRNEPDVHQLTARADEGLGLFPQAAQEYQLANEERPSEDRLFGAGYELVLAASLVDALNVFHSGEEQYPKSIPMRIGAGGVQILMGHTTEGVSEFVQASDLAPSDPRPYSLLASVFGIAKAESEVARERFKQYVEREPKNAFANYFYGISLTDADGPDRIRAEDYLKRAIELDPGLAKAHLALAKLYSDNKKYDDAVHEYEDAIRLEPRLSEAHYRLALAYKRVNRAAQSEREMQIFQQTKSDQTAGTSGIDIAQFISALDAPQADAAAAQCEALPR